MDAPDRPDPDGTNYVAPRLDPDATNYVAADPDATGYTPSAPKPPSGRRVLPCRFGEYELLEEIARGGMGVVYKAKRTAAGVERIVALKMIQAGRLATDESRQRFRREAEAASKLDHPGIVPVYEIGEEDGQFFFTMQLMTGGSLAERLRDGPLPPTVAAKLVRQIAEAVQHAHERGVIHRDLKPGNVLLCGEVTGGSGSTKPGEPSATVTLPLRAELTPKVADFGLARLHESDLSATGEVLGTPSWMPPEQARGDVRVGPAADVYGLGAVLYGLLTGRPPFLAASAHETMRQVCADEPVSPRRLNAGVPRDLEAVCLKCLEKVPTKRYASCAALADDLTRWANGEPVRARLPGAAERLVKWSRRNPAVAGLIATVLLVFAIGATAATAFGLEASWQAKEAKKAARREKDKAEEAKKNEERAVDQEKVAELRLYSGQLAEAQVQWQYGDPARALDLLDSCQWNLRHVEHHHLWTLYNSNQKTFRGHTGRVTSVAFSHDGRRILTGSEDKTAKLWDAEKGQELLSLKGHAGEVTSVAFSPDGNRILTRSGGFDNEGGRLPGEAKVWDAEKGTELLSLKGHTWSVTSVAFSPDGRRILTGSEDSTAKVWDAEKGQELFSLKGHTWSVTSVAFSPDGRRILTGSDDNTAKVWDAQKGTELLSLKGRLSGVTSVAFSPDGKRILTGSEGSTAKVWDAEKGTELLSLKGHTWSVTSVAFSPDGKRILTGSGELVFERGLRPLGEAKVWDAQKGTEVFSLKGHASGVTSVAFSPDGRRILTGSWDNTAKVWDAQTGQELLSFKGHTWSVTSVAFSPDGRRILTGSEDSTAKVWDAQKGQETLSLKGHTSGVSSVAFSPDGKRILTGSGGLVFAGGLPQPGEAKVWDAQKGTELLSLKGHLSGVTSVAFSPDGGRILTGSEDNRATVWDAQTGQELLSLKGHAESVTSVAFSHDGRRILTGSRGFDNEEGRSPGEAKVWDAQKGTEVFSLKGHASGVMSVAFSPDGRRILTGSWDNTAKVWDAQKGTELLSLKGHLSGVTSVAFSPDGKRILTGSEDSTAKVWDAEKGQELFSLKGHTWSVTSVAFSPDGKRTLTGSRDNTAKVWDAEKGQELLSLKGHTGSVSSVAFSADGKRILTGSHDKTAKVWDAEKRQELLFLKGHTDEVTSVAFSLDGKRVFAWDAKGNVLAWAVADGKPVAPTDPPAKPAPGPAISPDGRLFAKPDGSRVAITDLRNPPRPDAPWPLPDLADRTRYHAEQAALAERAKHHFAAAFHLGRLLLDSPDDVALKKRREQALKAHADAIAPSKMPRVAKDD